MVLFADRHKSDDIVRRAVRHSPIRVCTEETPAEALPPEEVIFGSSRVMMDIRRKLERGAPTSIPVLLQGETGTGKEVLARFVHRASGCVGPFVKVNCAAVPGPLFESELFGYERGAFTGAVETKPGRVDMARGGTLFLDEIGDLDLNLQAKLLQFLQDGSYYRIGGQVERRAEARVVCATNQTLYDAVKSGAFRQDLYYRISVLAAELPTLQDRRGDIPMLVGYFLDKYGRRHRPGIRPLSNPLLARLQELPWPGNIRQLENLVHRYVVFESEQIVWDALEEGDADHRTIEVPQDQTRGLKDFTSDTLREVQRRVILEALDANCWHRTRTARALGISYGTLLSKIKQAGLPLKSSRQGVGSARRSSGERRIEPMRTLRRRRE